MARMVWAGQERIGRTMKNIIPLVVAVLLGLAAVFAVSRTMSKQTESVDKKIQVVAAARAIGENDTIAETNISPRLVSITSLPKQHVKWSSRTMIIGQKAVHAVAKGDYILLSDVAGTTGSMGSIIGDGEWGVPVMFADDALMKILQPGDEIAIGGTFHIREQIKRGKDADAGVEEVEREVTTIIFPRVRILEIIGGGVMLSLPPQQALAISAIQRKVSLFPLLRRTNDTKALNRKDGGIFEDSSMNELIEGLTPVSIPAVPTEVKE